MFRMPNGFIKIANELEAALKNLRRNDKLRYLWADAICINQEDMAERGSQVSILNEIF